MRKTPSKLCKPYQDLLVQLENLRLREESSRDQPPLDDEEDHSTPDPLSTESSARKRREKNNNIALSKRPPGKKIVLTFRAVDGRPSSVGDGRTMWYRHLGSVVHDPSTVSHRLLKWKELSVDQLDLLGIAMTALEMGQTPSVVEVFKRTRTPKPTKENPAPVPDERAQEKIVEMEEVRSTKPEISNFELTERVFGQQKHGGSVRYFNQCPHPNELDRCRIGQELGLTPNQVRNWYQNKRTNLKGKNEKEQGYTLREENDMLKVESQSLKELIDVYTCNACKVFTPAELEKLASVRQLQAQNMQLRHKYYDEYNSTMAMGIPVPLIQDFLPPMQVSSFNQSNGGFLGESSMEPINPIFANANDIMNTIMNPQQDSETWNMMQTIGLAREELMNLLNVNEPFWLKDMTDGRYIIHRDTYDAKFLNTSVRENRQQNGFRTRFESSKDEAILTMSASRVAEMLMDSKMRVDYLFPTIITEAFTIKEYGNQTSPRQVGSIKLVFEQMHLLTPFVTPRDYCFVRFCEKVTEGMWLIVEVSHDFKDSSLQLNSPSRAWRLPSGCLIKDVSHGVSQVTWVEHVELEDKAPIHRLYKDVIFRGLAFTADRWVQTLSTSCHKMNIHDNILQNQFDSPLQKMGGAMTQEDRKCIMSITNKMMKRFCGNMNMIDNLEMVRLNDNDVYLSLCRDQENVNPSRGLIVNVATSFWLDAPCQVVIDFLKNVNLRAQWDAVCNGGAAEEIVCIRFGDQLDNSISIIKPHIESTNNLLVIQETLVDPLGAVIAYAPIDREDFIGELYGSCSKPVLVSGFIISKDGNPKCMQINHGGASTSSNVAPAFPNGSLITTAFQVMSYSKDIDMEFMNILTSIISTTMDRIKLAFNCPDPSV
ncbi:homeobox-leucine zipper protein HDG12-like [Impatiens glandulifera]|uniref:homeobox-leucine zipper protein HDG12-like n=1 Tax=Impatiens glandulifera TaxID=253017 RepID=UPI001FB14750|nr:homeobox-leucine zipper protein HDG12-like [Impatiens glandulifera]